MKCHKENFLTAVGTLALWLTALPGWTVAQTGIAATNPPASVKLTSVSPNALAATPSESVREAIKMANSGVSEDVVKAYIENSLSTFNLTAENIIQLQQEGVSSSIILAMLHHDAALMQKGSVPPPPQDQPPLPPPDETRSSTPPVNPPTDYGDAGAYYNNLAPYGNWSYLPDYGYYWQPYSTFWAAYPGWGYPWWGWLNTGWWFCAGRGWCWFPRFHDRGYGHDHNHGFGFPGHHDHNFAFHGGERNGIGGRAGFTGGRADHQFTTPVGDRSGGGNRLVASNNRFGGNGTIGGQNRFQTFARVPTSHQPMTMYRPNSSPAWVNHSGSRGGNSGFGGGMRGGGGGGHGGGRGHR
jgi:hypothetical protein